MAAMKQPMVLVRRQMILLLLVIVLAIGDWRKHSAAAFSLKHRNAYDCARASSMRRHAIRRPNDDDNRQQWVSYLEEAFHQNDDNQSNHTTAIAEKEFETPLTTLANPLEFLDTIDQCSEELVVVLFFAHYCRTCHKANLPFKQLAYEFADSNVRFVRLETSALSPPQFRSLGLDRVPFLQIYERGDCVASFSAVQKIGRSGTKLVLKERLLDQLRSCQQRSKASGSAFRTEFAQNIRANKDARNRLRVELVAGNTMLDNSSGEEHWYKSIRTLTSEDQLLRLVCQPPPSNLNTTTTTAAAAAPPHTEHDDSKITVVMFHSQFDPSCRRAQHKFRKLAEERQQEKLVLARIEASLLPEKTLAALGIRNYPYIQIYLQQNCVASFSIPRSFLFSKMLHESLDAIDRRTPEEWQDFYRQHEDPIRSQRLVLEGILRLNNEQNNRR